MSTIQTVRPITQAAIKGLTKFGTPATYYEAMADDTGGDASYMRMNADSNITFTFPNPAAVTGKRLAWCRFRIRCKRAPVGLNVTNPKLTISLDGRGALSTDQINMDTTWAINHGSIQTVIPPGPYPMRGRAMITNPVNLVMRLSRRDEVLDPWTDSSPEIGLYIYGVYVDVVWADRPTVSVRNPVPGSTIITDNTPRAVWTPKLDPEGGPQDGFQVSFFDASLPGLNPDSSPMVENSGYTYGAARLWDPDTPMDDDTLRCYVRVAQLISNVRWFSDWKDVSDSTWLPYSEFTLLNDKPAVPTFTFVGEPTYGRIKFTLTKNAGGIATTHWQVQLTHDNWATYEWMRTAFNYGFIDASTSPKIWFDYESRANEETKYRARAVWHDPANPTPVDGPRTGAANIYSGWTPVITAEWESTDWWLKHPFDRTKSMVATPQSQPSRQRTARQGTFQPLGRSDVVIISDTYAPFTGTLVVRLDTDLERETLKQLLDTGDPILIQAPMGTYYWSDKWVIVNDHSSDRLIDAYWSGVTYETLNWTQVKRPAGPLWFE